MSLLVSAHPVPARAHVGVGALAQGHECVMYVCVMLALGSWKGGAGPPFRGGRVLCHDVWCPWFLQGGPGRVPTLRGGTCVMRVSVFDSASLMRSKFVKYMPVCLKRYVL